MGFGQNLRVFLIWHETVFLASLSIMSEFRGMVICGLTDGMKWCTKTGLV